MSACSLQALGAWPALALIVAATLGPSLLIARLTAGSISGWYAGLRKPSWNPPNCLFGPVWTVLYLAMSVAVGLVGRAAPEATLPLVLYVLQLALNHSWSPIFFLARKPGLALAVLTALWLTAACMTWVFHAVDPRAAQLLLPYMAWLSYAGSLNYWIWKHN